MKIWKKFAGFTSKGIRTNNEDYILPDLQNLSSENEIFIVCDGVGGAARGEIASRIAADSYSNFILRNFNGQNAGDFYHDALQFTEKEFDKYIRDHPAARGMATTIALLHFNRMGADVAWCGDSRIYHIRGNSVLFQTEDHSQVSMMVKAGLLTREEIASHPDKNILTRAIQGTSVRKTKIDTARLNNINAGDYFFVCSDGVWEVVSNEILTKICSGTGSIESKIEYFEQICGMYSHDNYSGFLIGIENIEKDKIQLGMKTDEDDEIPFARIIH